MVEELVANPMLGFFEETNLFTTLISLVAPVSVDLRVNRISAISGHMHRLEGRRTRACLRRRAACACLPNDAYAQRWR